ncbi:hypothetical protein Y032_0041g359 [Ancylostoma ceylanicum]|uniref:Uncharacterized protein n=1 Tax=Ancylostoma ceylanicum TaxID=53326 RepID=A0A016UFP2_9BILA|nr:hypothetical protein Y032_0041g359 [Ancylostoma ceylanicum]
MLIHSAAVGAVLIYPAAVGAVRICSAAVGAYWDCNIEYNAYLLNCGDPSAKVPTDYGDISASINLGGKCEDPYDQTLPILQNWWNQVKLEELSTPDINPATQNNFGMMANGPTTGFACTYNKKCSGKLLCLYNTQPSKNQNANELYTAANPPNTPICACPGCTSYLCPSSPYEPSKITYPQTSCATKDDPEDGITSFMQTMAQDMVNYYRRLVGSGWAPDRSGYALPAKKMTAVKYDCTIGDLTKDLADACTAPNTASPGYSVSYYEERDLTKTPMEVLSTAIKKWAEQSKLVDLGETVTFSGDVEAKAPDFAKVRCFCCNA